MNSAGNRRRRSTSAHCGIRAMCALALCAPLAAIASSAPGPHSAAPVPAVEIEVATEAEPTGRNTAQRRRIPIPPPPMAHTERCGTIVRPDDWPLLLERQAAGLYSLPAKAIAGEFTVPVTNHVIRRSNGTGGLSAAALADQMAGANALWEPAGIQFCQWGRRVTSTAISGSTRRSTAR